MYIVAAHPMPSGTAIWLSFTRRQKIHPAAREFFSREKFPSRSGTTASRLESDVFRFKYSREIEVCTSKIHTCARFWIIKLRQIYLVEK